MKVKAKSKMLKHLLMSLTLILAAIFIVCSFAHFTASAVSDGDIRAYYYARMAEQISVTASNTPQTKVYVSFTTVTDMDSAKIYVSAKGSSEKTEYNAVKDAAPTSVVNELRTGRNNWSNVIQEKYNYNEEDASATAKTFYSAALDNLTPNTQYEYFVRTFKGGNRYDTQGHRFNTFPDKNSKESFGFTYITDTQAKLTNLGAGTFQKNTFASGNAATATSQFAKEMFPDDLFMYAAGDFTEEEIEAEYENLFNQYTTAKYEADPNNGNYRNPGQIFNQNYVNRFSDYTIVGTQGNHDRSALWTKHFKFDNDTDLETDPAGRNMTSVYSFDAGVLKFVVLNGNLTSASFLQAQETLLRAKVAEARAAGQYVIVAMHQIIYNGGDHISGVAALRKFWSPIFAELNVEAVLGGHDHTLSRGQVDKDGVGKGTPQKVETRTYQDTKKANAPLYMVGGSAGQVQLYAPVPYGLGTSNPGWHNLTVDDPIALDYSFLDFASAFPVGSSKNPEGPMTGLVKDNQNPALNSANNPTFTHVKVSESYMMFDTYMFGFDDETNTVTIEPFLFDSYTLKLKDSAVTPADVVAKISKIKVNVTESDRIDVLDARAGYDALSSAEKAAVNNYSKLINAESGLGINPPGTLSLADIEMIIQANPNITLAEIDAIIKANPGVTLSQIENLIKANPGLNAADVESVIKENNNSALQILTFVVLCIITVGIIGYAVYQIAVKKKRN